MRHPNPAVIVGCIWSNHWNWVSPPLDGINGIFSSPPQWNMNRRGDIYGRGSNAVVLRHTLDRFKCGRCHLPRITCDKIPMVSEMQDDHLTMWRLLQPPLHLLTNQNKCKHLTDVNKSIPLWWNCPKLDFFFFFSPRSTSRSLSHLFPAFAENELEIQKAIAVQTWCTKVYEIHVAVRQEKKIAQSIPAISS